MVVSTNDFIYIDWLRLKRIESSFEEKRHVKLGELEDKLVKLQLKINKNIDQVVKKLNQESAYYFNNITEIIIKLEAKQYLYRSISLNHKYIHGYNDIFIILSIMVDKKIRKR